VKDSYTPKKAQHKSYVRWKYRKPYLKKIRQNDELERFIRERLKLHWSPETIAGVWSQQNKVSISPLTSYKYVYSVFGCNLSDCLYSKRERKKTRKSKAKRALIPNRVWIERRPKAVERRKRSGDYEGDLIVSRRGDRTVIATLVCRSSRMLLAALLPNKRPTVVCGAMQTLLSNKPLKTVTLDNGVEFREHRQLGCRTYFCHPYSSWEKGSIEYANRLIRRYFPKKTKLSRINPKQLAFIVHHINHTPRKCLNWKTPAEVFAKLSSVSKSVAFNPKI
jgi:transposase, IS30 family